MAAAEAELAFQQTLLQQQLNALRTAVEAAEDADRARILDLINDLDNVTHLLNTAQNDLVTANANLARAKNNLVTAEEAKAALILANTTEIEANNAAIEALGDPASSTRAQVQEMINYYTDKVNQARPEQEVVFANWGLISTDVRDYKNDLWDNDRFDLATGDMSFSSNMFTKGYNIYDDYGNLYQYEIDYSACLADSTVYIKFPAPPYGYLEHVSANNWAIRRCDFYYCGADTLAFDAMIAAIPTSREYILAKEALDTAEARCARYLDSSSHPDGDQIRDLMIEVDTMTARWNREHNNYNDLMLTNAQANLANYIENCNLNVEGYQFEVDILLGKIDDIKEVRAWYTGEDDADYQDMVEEYLTIVELAAEYYTDYFEATEYINYFTNFIYDLEQILNGTTDVAAQIAAYQARNTFLQDQIDDYTAIDTQEKLIDQYTAEIADLEAKIDIYQAQYDALRAQIEALMAE